MDTANERKRLPPLATTATKPPKSTAVTSGISKTLARSTTIVPQKTIHNFVCSTISLKTQTDQFSSETLKSGINFEWSSFRCFLSDYGYIHEWFWKTKHRF